MTALALPVHRCTVRGVAAELLQHTEMPIYITGSSGWFGRCLLEMLHGALGQAGFDRRVQAFTSAGRTVALRDGLQVATQRFDTLAQASSRDSVLLNFAYLTKEQTARVPLAEYVAANRAITDQVLQALDRLQASAFFSPSSGAVYRPHADEPEYSAANAYSKLKLEDEQRARDWADAAPGRRAILCRVFNVSGPYINKYTDYALSSIIDSVLRGMPVEIRTPVRSLRSFVAIDELLSLVLAMLLAPGQPTACFDSAGEDELEIGDLFAAVGVCIPNAVPLKRPALVDQTDRYLGDRTPYAALLARYGVPSVSLHDQIAQTAHYISEHPGH